MNLTKLLFLYHLFLLTTAEGVVSTSIKGRSLSLQIGDHERLSLQTGLNHSLTVHTANTNTVTYSAFSVQLHTQQAILTLYNGSDQCLDRAECVTRGKSVGMVQIMTNTEEDYVFVASIECGDKCGDNVSVLVAAVGVEINHPIPGGCAQTSNLENDAQLMPQYSRNALQLYFQKSDVGFDPASSSVPPVCDFNATFLSRLDYYVYRKCLPLYDFSTDTYFDAIEEMLIPGTIRMSKLQTYLKYGDRKRLLFDSSSSRGEVYNVFAFDNTYRTASAYVPVVTYGCNFTDGSCFSSIPVSHMILGPIIGIVGLFLCLLAHRFFHVEVYIFTALIFSFLFFILLNAVTTWTYTFILCGSVGFGAVMGVLLYGLWFFLGWYYIFVIFFGAAADFIVAASILFTPLISMFPVLQLNYVYALLLVCGVVLFMVVFVAFPRALNIVSSSLVGSYSIVFCVGMFKRTLLTEIILKVVKNAAIPGFLSSYSSCQLEIIDIILSAVWVALFFIGIITQALLAVQHQRAHRRRQARTMNITSTGEVVIHERYRPFPDSPYKQLKRRFRRESEHSRPLLSPHSATLYGAVN